MRKWLCKREKRTRKGVFLFSFSGVWINREVRNYTSSFPCFRRLPCNQTLCFPLWKEALFVFSARVNPHGSCRSEHKDDELQRACLGFRAQGWRRSFVSCAWDAEQVADCHLVMCAGATTECKTAEVGPCQLSLSRLERECKVGSTQATGHNNSWFFLDN